MKNKNLLLMAGLVLLFATNVSAEITVQTKDIDCSPVDNNWRRLAFLLTNTGTEDVNMSEVAIEYDFSESGARPFESEIWYYSVRAIDWMLQGGTTDEVAVSFQEGDDYTVLRLNFGDRILPAAGQAEIQMGIHNADWSMIDESNDPSYLNSCSYTTNPWVSVQECEECDPSISFDIHFIVFEDIATYGQGPGGTPGPAITDAHLQAEVDYLNQKFRTEHGQRLVTFNYKSSVYIKDEHYLYDNPDKITGHPDCVKLLECKTPYMYVSDDGVQHDNAYFEMYKPKCPQADTDTSAPITCGGDSEPEVIDCDSDSAWTTRDCYGVYEAHNCEAGVEFNNNYNDCKTAFISGAPIVDDKAINVMIRGGFLSNINSTNNHMNRDAATLTWDPFVNIDFRRLPAGNASASAYFEHEMGHAFGLGHVYTCFQKPMGSKTGADANIMIGGTYSCHAPFDDGQLSSTVRNTGFYMEGSVDVPQNDPAVDDYSYPIQDQFCFITDYYGVMSCSDKNTCVENDTCPAWPDWPSQTETIMDVAHALDAHLNN